VGCSHSQEVSKLNDKSLLLDKDGGVLPGTGSHVGSNVTSLSAQPSSSSSLVKALYSVSAYKGESTPSSAQQKHTGTAAQNCSTSTASVTRSSSPQVYGLSHFSSNANKMQTPTSARPFISVSSSINTSSSGTTTVSSRVNQALVGNTDTGRRTATYLPAGNTQPASSDMSVITSKAFPADCRSEAPSSYSWQTKNQTPVARKDELIPGLLQNLFQARDKKLLGSPSVADVQVGNKQHLVSSHDAVAVLSTTTVGSTSTFSAGSRPSLITPSASPAGYKFSFVTHSVADSHQQGRIGNSVTCSQSQEVSRLNTGSRSSVVTPSTLSAGSKFSLVTPSLLSPGSQSSIVAPMSLSSGSKFSSALSAGTRSSAVTPLVSVGGSTNKTEWQLEAEKRISARSGAYIDPEKYPRGRPTVSTMHSDFKSYDDSKSAFFGSGARPPVTHLHQPPEISSTRPKTWEERKASLAFTPSPSPALWSDGRPQANPSAECCSVKHQRDHQQDLREQNVMRKKSDSSEPPMTSEEILNQLEELDEQLRVIESEGRDLEDNIRKSSDDAMDDDLDNNMVKWFSLVKQRYEFIREESYLMYRKRQQELEDLHEELEYQLRHLIETPDELKTVEEKQEEERLLNELMETVSLRNSIVDSIEVDRLRYLEEDQKLEDMMAESGLTSSKGSKKGKNSRRKKGKRFMEKDAKSMDKAKTKKKLFYFTAKSSTSPRDDNSGDTANSRN
jgi:hypothetical protein